MLLIQSCAFSTFNGEFNFLTIENTIYCRLYGENTAQGVLQHRPWVEGFGELGGGGVLSAGMKLQTRRIMAFNSGRIH